MAAHPARLIGGIGYGRSLRNGFVYCRLAGIIDWRDVEAIRIQARPSISTDALCCGFDSGLASEYDSRPRVNGILNNRVRASDGDVAVESWGLTKCAEYLAPSRSAMSLLF